MMLGINGVMAREDESIPWPDIHSHDEYLLVYCGNDI